MAQMRRLRGRSGLVPYPFIVSFDRQISHEEAEPMLRFAKTAGCGLGFFTWGWRETEPGSPDFETVFGFTDARAARAFEARWRLHAAGRCSPSGITGRPGVALPSA